MPAPFKGGKRKWLPAVLLTVLGMMPCGCGGPSSKVWMERLRSKDSAERLHAVKALAAKKREAEVVAPVLAAALKDENAFVRRDAAEALGELGAGAKPALPALQAAARDRNADVRKQAVKALKRIDPQAAASAGVR